MVEVSQRMSMQLRQSPQQVLLSTLLQLPVLALEQRIKIELQENPLLEEVMEEEVDLEEQQEPELEQEKPAEDEPPQEGSEPEDAIVEEEKEEIDWDLVLDEEEYEFRLPKDRSVEEYERPEVSVLTLAEHLLEQLNLQADLSREEREIGENIIWNINEDGYLATNLDEIALNLNVPLAMVEKILQIIQGFEPLGIGARDLKECLLIQLTELHGNESAKTILMEHFDDFKNKRFEKIAKKMELPLAKVKDAMDEIARLNPKPGDGFISQRENYVIPDVIVERVDDDFIVVLNDSHVPHLRISQAYRQMLSDRKKTPREVKTYIRKRLESARWLINSIYQRRATIYKVMTAIIEKQRQFFDKGSAYLKPMILKDIADEVSMDISTISRVTNGKYVQTDFGVFELKYFFSEKMRTSDGDEVSNKQIKDRIRQIIENENPKKPFNDQTIVKILAKEGFPLARRTVAKYREQMKLPVARMRRRI